MTQISISLSDWVIETYLSTNLTNRSGRIEELIIKGYEAEEGKVSEQKRRILNLRDELKLKDLENTKLKQHIGRIESALNKKNTAQHKITRYDYLNENAVKCNICGGLISEDGKRHKFPIGIVCGTCFLEGRDSDKWNTQKVKK